MPDSKRKRKENSLKCRFIKMPFSLTHSPSRTSREDHISIAATSQYVVIIICVFYFICECRFLQNGRRSCREWLIESCRSGSSSPATIGLGLGEREGVPPGRSHGWNDRQCHACLSPRYVQISYTSPFLPQGQ